MENKKKPVKEILDTVVYNLSTKKRLTDEQIDKIYETCNKVPLIPFKFDLQQEIQKLGEQEKQQEQQNQNTEKQENQNKNENKQQENEDEDEDNDEIDERFTYDIKENIEILKNNRGIVYIDNKKDLFQMICRINQNAKKHNLYRVIGIDTEQSFQQTYQPYLSLIQISTLEADYVVDCIQIEKQDIKMLKCILENKNIVKTFYAGQSDLVWLKRDFQLQVYNYCDLQVLAELVYGKKGDNSLVTLWEDICDYKMTKENKKALQISEWSNRPLTQQQIEYSALDAHYLIYLRYYLIYQILETDGIDYIVDELYKMQLQVLKPYESKVFNEKQYLALAYKMIKNTKGFNVAKFEKQEISKIFLVELARLREDIAIKNNLNLGLLCSDKDLMLITGNLLYQEDTQPETYEKNVKAMEKLRIWTDFKSEIQNLKENITINQKSEYLEKLNTGLLKQEKKNKEKELKKEKLKKKVTCKEKPYENCQLLAPSGLALCNCDRKKIEWYLKNGLGDIVKEEPLTLKLNFQPSGTDNLYSKGNEELSKEIDLEDGYYTTHRENCCVVCGSSDDILKFHIVPPMYRTHFPNKFKSHRSHDVLLFCYRCHKVISVEFDKKKKDLAKQYNVPLQVLSEEKVIIKQLLHFIALNKNYISHKEKMRGDQEQKTVEKINNLYQELSTNSFLSSKIKFLDKSQLELDQNQNIVLNQKFLDFCTQDLNEEYKKLTNFEEIQDTSNYKNKHGEEIIKQFDTEDKLIEFIKLWRQFFLDTMNPKYLPPGWKIDHKFSRGFGESSIFNDEEKQENQNDNQTGLDNKKTDQN